MEELKWKKTKKVISNDDLKKNALAEKIIDLFLWYQIEESNNIIKIFGNEIKFYEEEKKLILDKCIFSFQRKKAYKKIAEIDEKIFKLYEKIGEEVRMVEEIKSSIDQNSNIKKSNIETTGDFLSYYDLLSFLKRWITFKKVSLTAFDQEIMYIYDYEGNYVLEDINNESPQFAIWLSDCSSDNTKFEKNIKIIEK